MNTSKYFTTTPIPGSLVFIRLSGRSSGSPPVKSLPILLEQWHRIFNHYNEELQLQVQPRTLTGFPFTRIWHILITKFGGKCK